jgi:hypothetical protein
METTKKVTMANVNLNDPAELALLHEHQDALFAERKEAILVKLKRDGLMNGEGNFVFNEPLPADMQPDSPADFKH